METTIVKIEDNKIEVVENNEIQEYELEEWVKPEFVKLGAAEITIKDGKVSFVNMLSSKDIIPKDTKDTKDSKEKKSGKWEDDMVTFEDLLTKAHELKTPFSIKTEMLQIDLEKKYALFKAKVIVGENPRTKVGELEIEPRVFEGHGDATADNVTGDFIKPHFIRMAETRAIVRALRWYTNNGCAEEEK